MQTAHNALVGAHCQRQRVYLLDWTRPAVLGLLAGLLQSNFGCMAYWGVRRAIAEGHLEYAELELAALRAWAERVRPTLDLL